MKKIEGSPLVIFGEKESWADFAGRDDVLLFGMQKRDGRVFLCLRNSTSRPLSTTTTAA